MKKIIEFIKKHKIVFISLLITLFIEIFICNYGYFRTLFRGNINLEKEYTFEDNSILIKDIDTRLTSIYFEYENKLTDQVSYTVTYLTEDSSSQVSLEQKTMLKNDKHYINFDTHAKCKQIRITTTLPKEIKLKKIVLNHPNLNISILRLIIIFISSIFILKVKNKSIYQKEYNKNDKEQRNIFLINLAVFSGIIILYIALQTPSGGLILKKENIDKEDSLLMQTEAILNGQIQLLEVPSIELKNMDNPYNYEEREFKNIPYLYDVAYYNGAYYNYFGIAPIITSILPFRIITGNYLHTHIFNLIYIITFIFSLYFLYRNLINKYIKKISLCNYYLGFYALLFATNIFTLLRGQKYDIVVASGLAFLLISLNLAISIYKNKKGKVPKLIFLGITTALIVLSKPNFIVYYIIITFFIITSMKKISKKEKIKDWLLILVPLGIFAIFQMILNYIRFDSIFEFGAKYQLTAYNMNTCISFTFGKIYAGLVEYIFKTPTINPLNFPFVFPNADMSNISINEICYENVLVGLIAIPILYIYFLKGNIINKIKEKELNKFINLCIITAIISIIISTCCGGICEVYSIDFKLILSIGAVILLSKWIEKNKDINKIFMLLCLATIIIMLPITLTTENKFLTNQSSKVTITLKNIFEFWN